MDWRSLIIVFWSVFLAEIGDKTQLATMMFSAEGRDPYIVFIGSAVALILAAGIGVVAGNWLSTRIDPSFIKMVAGAGFIIIGVWTLFSR
jgi:putative Ca2+/H+ antiporter (TMEM165/GDT1 family)